MYARYSFEYKQSSRFDFKMKNNFYYACIVYIFAKTYTHLQLLLA